MQRGRSWRAALGAVLALCGAVPATAGATTASETALPAPTKLSGAATWWTDVAVNAAGQSVVAWTEVRVIPPDTAAYAPPERTEIALLVAFRGPGTAWSTPERVPGSASVTSSPQVSMDAAGNATIAWTEGATASGFGSVHVVRHTSAGFVDQQTFAPPAGWGVSLAANARGDAVLTWSDLVPCNRCFPDTDVTVWAAMRLGGTTFGPPQAVTDTSKTWRVSPVGSINARGDIAIAWEQGTTTDGHVQARQRPAGGDFGPLTDIAVGHVASASVNVIIAPGGETTLTWWREQSMQASRLAPDGSVTSTVTLTGRYDTVFTLGAAALGVDDAGRISAAWLANDGLWTATAEPGGDLGGAVLLDRYASTLGSRPTLAEDGSGSVVVSWISAKTVRVAWKPAGAATFQAPATIRGDSDAVGANAVLAGDHLVLITEFRDFVNENVLFATVGTPAAITPAPAPTPAPVLADTAAPSLKIRSASVVRVRTGKHSTSRLLRLVVDASEPARIVVTITRRAAGVRRGGSCVAPSARRSAHAKVRSCSRLLNVGRQHRFTVPAGVTTVDLGAAPRRGSYAITLAGVDTAGNAAAPAVRRLRVG